jgi:antitoxin component YwqK of YwqJK toxin-antitoxin module
MKKILLLAALFVSSIGFAQSLEPQLEVSGNLVKATYFHENGKVQQVGYFKDGKLEGKWNSYDVNGLLQVSATYSEGKKNGTWVYYNNTTLTKQIDYSNNLVVSVRDNDYNQIVSKN